MGAFSPSEVGRLAELAGIDLGARDAERLQVHTAGLPLYVRTLLRELTAERLAAGGGELPAPRSLASATLARLAEVPPSSRELASALAVLNQKTSLATLSRVAEVADPTDALDALLATGFVEWIPGDVVRLVAFSHPLYRSAVYDDLSPSVRQRLHLAAAGVSEPDAALRHRVAAADAPDPELAADLEVAGERAGNAARWGVAAQYLGWATELTPESELQERRLLSYARDLLEDGQIAAAATLEPRVEAARPGPRRDLVIGLTAWGQGDAARAERLTRSAAEAEDDPELAADAWLKLASQFTAQDRGREALETATRALAVAPQGSHLEDLAWSLRAMGIGQIEGAPHGLEALAPRPSPSGRATARSPVTGLLIEGVLHTYSCQPSEAARCLRAVIELARGEGVPVDLARAHVLLAQALFTLGDWRLASVNAHTAVALVDEEGQVWNAAQAHSAAAQVPAGQGEWEAAEAHVQRAGQAAIESGTSESVYTALLASAALHRARGQHELVVSELLPLLGGNDGRAVPMFSSLSWWVGLIASLIEMGDLDAAGEQIGHLEVGAQRRGIDFAGRLAGLRGRLAAARQEPEAAGRAFRQALTSLGPDDPLLDRAEVHLEYGRLLRATGERQDATTQLRQARALLEPVGAAPYLERVDAELARVGISSDRARSSPLSLTDREQDVVALVAKGLTNREVAAELYVSQKAVEYHLSNVFAKLGITSRRQLRNLVTAD